MVVVVNAPADAGEEYYLPLFHFSALQGVVGAWEVMSEHLEGQLVGRTGRSALWNNSDIVSYSVRRNRVSSSEALPLPAPGKVNLNTTSRITGGGKGWEWWRDR